MVNFPLLVGKTINQWTVESLQQNSLGADSTGGYFSVGYIVRDSVNSAPNAFLKIISSEDLLTRSREGSPILEVMTSCLNSFSHEKMLLEQCAGQNLSHIVRLIDGGECTFKDVSAFPLFYLIFELADGNIRKFLDFSKALNEAWILRSIHNTTVGLAQLHKIQVAHQDIKPSNILVFDNKVSKIGDVGRSVPRISTIPAEHLNLEITGDLTYTAIEMLYGYFDTDWATKRLCCDLYMLGNLIVFYFTRVNINTMIKDNLDRTYWCPFWGGTYSGTYENALPYIQRAFSEAVFKFKQILPEHLAEDISVIVTDLCNPDFSKRGHPKNKVGHNNPFGLERFISKLNTLANLAEGRFIQLGKR